MFGLFFRKKIVGIDVGAFGIKIVELSRWGRQVILENYAYTKSDAPTKESSTQATAEIIKQMLVESKIKTKKVIFSVPDVAIFCIALEIPPMPEKEIAGAVAFSAAQYLTLPISEVTLDWQVKPQNPQDKNAPLKVFLVAIPNQVINDYKAIAKAAGLQLYALEAEVLGIQRALVRDRSSVVCLVDIGWQSSTISIVDQGFLKESYSFDFSSKLFENSQAEASTLAMPLLAEIEDVVAEFLHQERRAVQAIYLTGGGAHAPGLAEFLGQRLKKEVVVPNAFGALRYPSILDAKFKQMGGRFSAAVGVALSYFSR